jgi:hypothetical protein
MSFWESHSVLARVTKVSFALSILGIICLVNIKLALVISLFAVGSTISASVEKGPAFCPTFAFHKCCAEAQWAMMSFYLYIFEWLLQNGANAALYLWVAVLLLVTMGMYIFSIANFNKVIRPSGDAPGIYKTDAEKRNVGFAAWTVGILLLFLLWMRFKWGVTF